MAQTRVTGQRQLVLEAAQRSCDLPTADQIYLETHKAYAGAKEIPVNIE